MQDNPDITLKLKPDYILDSQYYYTVKKFARLVSRTEETIRHLITHGNIIRRLTAHSKYGQYMIPISEYTDFPFCEPGRGGHYSTYNLDGTLTQGNVNTSYQTQRMVLLLRVIIIKRTINNGLDVDGNLVENDIAQRTYQNKNNQNQDFFIPPCDIFYTRTQIQDIDSRGDTPQKALNATIENLINISQNRRYKDTRFMDDINKVGICYCKEEEYQGSSIDIVKQMPIVPDKPIPYLAVYPILL